LLGFRDYSVFTGHATLYKDLPFWGLRATVSAGQYLAGDRGVTFDVSRRFKSGVRVGGFATFTNVSAADFGEGSFDKGFYIKVPLDLFLMRKSKQETVFGFRPLTRDGGQKLVIGPSLFELVDRGNFNDIHQKWRDVGR
ncbi:MAG: YjbH domain-containing protein, partial [Alphaproteobacteria bacterium]|nr:YjbH domain-containing protein [Alphaproteobacteria bacterium]